MTTLKLNTLLSLIHIYAAMDGYAVRLNDLRDGAALPVAGVA